MSTDATHHATSPQAGVRPGWRAVAMPTEHGGWGLTAEPIVLGLLLAPSIAGLGLGAATMLAFLVRTPVRLLLVDRHRHRSLDRTRLARRVAIAEAALIVVFVGAAAAISPHPFWWPVLAAAPLIGIELWFDARSRSRRLVPELAGAIGVSAAAAVIVVAAGHDATEAVGAWLILAARSTTAIPAVRDQIARLHHRPTTPRLLILADATAVVLAAIAVGVNPAFRAGAAAVVLAIVVQRATARTAVPAKVLGIRQSVLGGFVSVVTALGAHIT